MNRLYQRYFQFGNIKKIKLSKSEINSAADELEFYTLVDAKFRKIIKEQNENFIFAKVSFSELIGGDGNAEKKVFFRIELSKWLVDYIKYI